MCKISVIFRLCENNRNIFAKTIGLVWFFVSVCTTFNLRRSLKIGCGSEKSNKKFVFSLTLHYLCSAFR